MREIKTSKARLILVEVLEGMKVSTEKKVLCIESGKTTFRFTLPPGSFSFLCLRRDITEGMAEMICDVTANRTFDGMEYQTGFRDYISNDPKKPLTSALLSFTSLLSANKVDGSKNWAILIEQIKN